MNKLSLLKVLNPLLVLSFLLQAVTVVFIMLRTGPEWTIKVHIYNGLAFLALALVHVMLNWGWIKANMFKRKIASGTGQ
jgi:hypothetical protein